MANNNPPVDCPIRHRGQLLLSLSPPQNKPPPPPPVAALADADAALAATVQLAHFHQKKQQRIETLKAEVLDWRTHGRRDLEAMISEGDERLDAIEQAKLVRAVPYPELLAYAQNLSAFTSAPPNLPDLSLPGQAPPPLFPSMRRGHLNAEEPLGPLGETHSVGRPPSPSPEPHRAQAANPYRMDNRLPQPMFDLDLDLNPDLDL
ncbi:hypothetical protein BC826DRAFT_1098959 [Russula brevipes]|nr:hypothetical protein BC826DRAFT_1098959 [Russula brevipes]